MTEDKREEEVRRGEEAARLCNNPLFKQSIDEMKAAIIDQWRLTPVKDTELREQIWAIYVATFKFEEILRSIMDTGKMAAIQKPSVL